MNLLTVAQNVKEDIKKLNITNINNLMVIDYSIVSGIRVLEKLNLWWIKSENRKRKSQYYEHN